MSWAILHRHLVGVDPGGQGLGGGLGLIVILLADELLLNQLGITLQVALGLARQGLVLFQVGFGLLQGRLIGPGIDDEEQVALFDVLALLKIDLDQLPGDPGLDAHGGVRLDVADVADLHRHRLRLHLGHHHRHRGRRRGLLLPGAGGKAKSI